MGFRVGATLAVLPGAEKEEESHDGQIGDAPLPVSGVGELGNGGVLVDKQDKWDGAHLSGRRILLIVRNCLPRRKSVWPMLLCRGSGAPTLAKICWATERRYCSTVHLQSGRPSAARWPVRTWWANVWRRGRGSWTLARKGLSQSSVQNLLHCPQLRCDQWRLASNGRQWEPCPGKGCRWPVLLIRCEVEHCPGCGLRKVMIEEGAKL
jgi:hypothetical protein